MLLNDCYQTLVDVLAYRAEAAPHKTACIFLNRHATQEEQRTYAQLDKQAQHIAKALITKGVKKGDRALLIFAPGLELIEAFFGCLYAGVIAVPVYPPMNEKLIEKTVRIIKNATPKVALLTQDTLLKLSNPEEVTEEFEGISCITTDSLPSASTTPWQKPNITADDIAFLQYTSGSTRHPKGVMISHGNLVHNLDTIYHAFGMTEKSVVMGWLPPYHDMGLIGNILTPLYGGLLVILTAPFSFLQNPISWLKCIDKYKVTISGGPNFAYDYCVKRIKEDKKQGLDLSSWQLAFNGAEPVRKETLTRFYEAFKQCGFSEKAFYPCYGLAEATLLVTGSKPFQGFQSLTVLKESLQENQINFLEKNDPKGYNMVSSGNPFQEVLIVDSETLIPCEKDKVGEIWVKSPSVAKGYWKNHEETSATFNGEIASNIHEGPYLRTGDLGFMHDNELYVTGRIKDLIILYGKNHYPHDIEYTVHHADIHPALGDCAAFVVQENEEYYLTLMCEIRNINLSEEEQETLFNALFETVYEEHELELHTIVLIPTKTLPKTTSGKIRRQFCKKHLADKTIPIIATWRLN